MYNLDFETIKQVMQAHQKTGYLYADVAAHLSGLMEAGRAVVQLQGGMMVSCTIIGQSGKRLEAKEAIKRLERMGRLQWNFTLQESYRAATDSLSGPLSGPLYKEATGPLFALPREETSLFPRRLLNLEPGQMQGWPRLHRMIFALSDGTRSVAKITEVLSAAPEQVEAALRDLQSINVIALGPSYPMGEM